MTVIGTGRVRITCWGLVRAGSRGAARSWIITIAIAITDINEHTPRSTLRPRTPPTRSSDAHHTSPLTLTHIPLAHLIHLSITRVRAHTMARAMRHERVRDARPTTDAA